MEEMAISNNEKRGKIMDELGKAEKREHNDEGVRWCEKSV